MYMKNKYKVPLIVLGLGVAALVARYNNNIRQWFDNPTPQQTMDEQDLVYKYSEKFNNDAENMILFLKKKITEIKVNL